MRGLLNVVFGAVFAVSGVAQQPAPMLVGGQTRQVTAHIWAIEDRNTTPGVPNVGIVVGKSGVLVVDTGMGERNGRIALVEALKLAPGRQMYLVTTHVHPEHDLGAGAFPASTRLIRSADEEKDIQKHGLAMRDTFMARSSVNKELLEGATFRAADIHFDAEYDLDLGGVQVRILAMGPNHTLGDTAIFVPTEGVLFSGDVAMRGLPSFIPPDSSLKQWMHSLEVFQSLHPAVVIPSHGPIGDASYITNYQSLLTTVSEKTAAAKKQGMSADDAVASVTAELGTKYGDPARLRGAILTAYNEAP